MNIVKVIVKHFHHNLSFTTKNLTKYKLRLIFRGTSANSSDQNQMLKNAFHCSLTACSIEI